jgi:hypothetical protein
MSSLHTFGTDRTGNTDSKNSSIVACLFVVAETCLSSRYEAITVFVSRHVPMYSNITLPFMRCLASDLFTFKLSDAHIMSHAFDIPGTAVFVSSH